MKLVKLLLSIEDFFTTKHTKSKIVEWKTESFEREQEGEQTENILEAKVKAHVSQIQQNGKLRALKENRKENKQNTYLKRK